MTKMIGGSAKVHSAVGKCQDMLDKAPVTGRGNLGDLSHGVGSGCQKRFTGVYIIGTDLPSLSRLR